MSLPSRRTTLGVRKDENPERTREENIAELVKRGKTGNWSAQQIVKLLPTQGGLNDLR